jgi:8-oxo-dGTP diphosphatase
MKKRPAVGVAAIVIKNGKVLLGKRKGAHGSGTWAFPGGHLEFNESIEDCATREVLEETGLLVKNPRFATITNDVFLSDNKHYVTVFVVCDHEDGNPLIKEPDKCENWDWFYWNEFPKSLFLSLKNLLEQGFSPLGVKDAPPSFSKLHEMTAAQVASLNMADSCEKK